MRAELDRMQGFRMRLQAADAGFPGADRLWTASPAECGNARLMHIILRAGSSGCSGTEI